MTTSVTTDPRGGPAAELRPLLEPPHGVKARHLPLCVLLAVLAVVLSHVPLRHTDLWGHVAYGNWIFDQGRLPVEDPFMPLASGMPLVDTSWLSQIILAAVNQAGGAEGLSILFTCVTLATYIVLARVFFLQTQSPYMAFIGTALALVFGWSRLMTIRPEMFAALLFAVLLCVLTAAGRGGRPVVHKTKQVITGPRGMLVWIAVPLVMLVWANLHGSFICGLALLGCCFLGRAIDVAYESRSIRRVLSDDSTKRWLLLAELAAMATLVNPYGAGLLLHVAGFPLNPAIRSVSEWGPLVLLGTGGPEFALSWVILVIAMRHSRRRVSGTEVLVLTTFSVAAIAQHRMITWYAPVVVWVLVPHLNDVFARVLTSRARRRRLRSVGTSEQRAGLAGGWLPTFAIGLVIWSAFWLSGYSGAVLRTESRPPERLYSAETPLQLSAWLKDHSPSGLVFNPSWWGDWLVHDMTAAMPVYATSHVHAIPPHVWADYVRVERAGPGWESTLARYGVVEAIIDKRRQRSLAAALKHATGWHRVYEDKQAVVYRKQSRAAKLPRVTQEAIPASRSHSSPLTGPPSQNATGLHNANAS